MARLSFFLERDYRRRLEGLVAFLDQVLILTEAGYELSYGWEEASRILGHLFEGRAEGTFRDRLEQVAALAPADWRPWFAALWSLYREGGPLLPFLSALQEALRDRLRQEGEIYGRRLPFRLNLILLLFALPPLLALLFVPWLAALPPL